MELLELKDDFGDNLTLMTSRLQGQYNITAAYLTNPETGSEKERRRFSPNMKFAVSITTATAIHTLYFKTKKTAIACYEKVLASMKMEDI